MSASVGRMVAGGDDLAFEVERVGLRRRTDREVIGLGRIEHAAGQLGRLAERDRQHAGGQRVERPAVADLGLRLARLAQARA